jgi:hypothetical protein
MFVLQKLFLMRKTFKKNGVIFHCLDVLTKTFFFLNKLFFIHGI